ncbi:MAG: isocitrate lyase/phosphoenolpyruvate mutase family protein [Ginsengibacter sp.]
MTGEKPASSDKGKLFKELHGNGKLLVLPNVWDPLSALLLESLGYPAIATASASIALSNGFRDGEKIPFEQVLNILNTIVKGVEVPVTADIESGYATNDSELKENIKRLIDTGIAGINIEDSSPASGELISISDQCKKISIIRNIAVEKNVSLFINARADVYIHPGNLSKEEILSETISRGKAYKDAGADGFYPIVLKEKESIERIISAVGLPVNILLLPGIPNFEALQNMGVARISLGPGFLKIAVNTMKNVAKKLLAYEGMEEITTNLITSDYLNDLVSKSHQ